MFRRLLSPFFSHFLKQFKPISLFCLFFPFYCSIYFLIPVFSIFANMSSPFFYLSLTFSSLTPPLVLFLYLLILIYISIWHYYSIPKHYIFLFPFTNYFLSLFVLSNYIYHYFIYYFFIWLFVFYKLKLPFYFLFNFYLINFYLLFFFYFSNLLFILIKLYFLFNSLFIFY